MNIGVILICLAPTELSAPMLDVHSPGVPTSCVGYNLPVFQLPARILK